VAWIAERKDVLATLFWLLALLAWVRWTRRPTGRAYAVVALAMSASLMAKPMAVTLPLTLLLLDLWPLDRIGAGGLRRWRQLVAEKLPLFALSAASSVVTLLAQSAGGAVRGLEAYPLPVRMASAAVAYTAYLCKTVWPAGLAVFYPHPGGSIAPWKVLLSLAFLAAACWLALRSARRAPYLTVGWFWYLITLVPVIGLLQVGQQAMADRYTYVPLLGIFVAVAWSVPRLVDSRLAAVAAALVLAGFAIGTRQQLSHWHDAESLFSHALEVTHDNHVAHANLGVALADGGRLEEAIEHYQAALASRPHNVIVLVNLGNAYKRAGRRNAALESYRRALAIDPEYTAAYYNLGILLEATGRGEEAIAAYRKALDIDPRDAQVHNNLGNALARRDRLEEAIEHYRTAIRLRPAYGKAYANLAGALLVAGRPAEAWNAIAEARRRGFEPPAALLHDLRALMPEP
jgi:tetratricopeptide (TPR) repeat protein